MKTNCLLSILLLIGLLVGQVQNTQAQIGDIIGAAGSLGEGCSDGCGGGPGCGQGCSPSDLFFLSQFIEWNAQWISNRRGTHVPLGVELMLDAGVLPITYGVYRPRIRVNLGLFSTDYRYSILVQETLGETDIFATHDWQMLVLNPVLTDVFAMRIGIGAVYEESSQNFYQDHNLGLDFYMANQSVKLGLEGRYAYHFGARIAPRVEANAELKFRLLNAQHAKIYGGFNAFYARYYQQIDIWSVGVGLNFRFE